MTIRTLTLVSLVMVMGSATGCGGMRNFMFGRGARCGLCSRAGAIGNALNPLAPAPGAATAAPGCGTPRCGLFGRNAAPGYAAPTCAAPTYTAPNYAAPSTYGPMQGYGGGYQDCYGAEGYNDGGYSVGMAGDCGCGSSCGGSCNDGQYGGAAYDSGAMYHGGVVDPYLGSGAAQGGYPSGGMIRGDGFQPRTYQSNHAGQFDSRGDQIISADPLPPGAQFVN